MRVTSPQQAFISEIAPGAIAAQGKYGVPAAVTIAQAIDESGWGRSQLASKDHNLFGIKGTGPAGSDPLPTQEYENGHLVTRATAFRIYHNVAESIDDHGKLLATSEFYRQAMAYRHDPNAFAAALTGVYATDPDYGAKLTRLMQLYDLYRYDAPPPAIVQHAPPTTPAPAATTPNTPTATPTPSTAPAAPTAPTPSASIAPAAPTTATPTPPATPPVSGAAPEMAFQSAMYRPSARPKRAVQAKPPKPPNRTPAPAPAPAPGNRQAPKIASRNAGARTTQYQPNIPPSIRSAFITTAKVPLLRSEPLYRDIASQAGIHWELLAACDWMQCEARPRYSPVHGEKLGSVNSGGTIYRTKSAALERCAADLVELSRAVYRIDLTSVAELSVRDLANVFAAFRWGGLLKLHHTSAMEFPYSVAGLTAQHVNMRWPKIDARNTPDKPGKRFHMPFGAVPIVLSLDYPATV